MADFNYDMFSLGNTAKEKLREVSQEGAVPTGIGAKPADEQEPMDKGFYESMYEAITSYFDNVEEADKVLTGTKPSRDAIREMTLSEFDDMTLRSVEEAGVLRQDMGKTEAAVPEERKETRLIDVTDTELGKLTNVGPLEELAEDIDPGTIDTEPLDADGVQPTDGKGLMSPTTEDTSEDSTESSSAFATIIKSGVSETVDTTTSLSSGFDSLTEAEGTDIHLDGRGFVTLPYGIVPDKDSIKKSDGTTFDPTGKHGLTAANLTSVDYSGATKFGVSRSDYDKDQDFAKAVYAEFSKRTATEYGTGFDDLTDAAKQAAYDMAWNAGIGSAGWSSVKTMLQEASKEGTKSKDSLIGFTTNFKSGTDYPRGLLKRRLETYNLVANEGEKASLITTTAVMTDGKRTGTLYTIKDTNGGVLKTWTKPDTDEKLGDLEVPQ
jgi:hypothetical protein